MSTSRSALIIAVLVAAVLLWLSVFIVTERQKAIMFRLGEIVRSDYEPGMHFMFPVLNNVQKFDRRILTLDSRPEQILTGEKKNVLVDYFVKWRIEGVEAFYRSFGGREEDALARMAAVIKDALQAELGNRTIREVVAGERQQIMDNVAENVDTRVRDYGIDVIDVRIKQIELPPNVRTSVFARMAAERERIAKELRAEGEKAASIIRARADRERVEILAAAQRKAEEIRGTGDALATEIYATGYGGDPEFYEFYRSLQAYQNSFRDKQDMLVLEPNSEFFDYFNQAAPTR